MVCPGGCPVRHVAVPYFPEPRGGGPVRDGARIFAEMDRISLKSCRVSIEKAEKMAYNEDTFDFGGAEKKKSGKGLR